MARNYKSYFKTLGIRHFLKACILNGLLEPHSLQLFLEHTSRPPTEESDEDEYADDDELESLLTMSESEDSFWTGFNNHVNANSMETDSEVDTVDVNNNNNNDNNNSNANNTANQATANVAKENSTRLFELGKELPLSLKNLARIQIKESMASYTSGNALHLTYLPDVLKQFVCFQDEIENIKRLVGDYKDHDADSDNVASS